MGKINLYKIDKNKEEEFLELLENDMRQSDNHIEEDGFRFTLYMENGQAHRNLSWNWILDAFDVESLELTSHPRAILLIENREDIYALSFGHSYFLVDRFSDNDFGFNIGRKLSYKNVRTTSRTSPNSKKNKSIDSYIDYENLEFNSGESFTKLKAKVSHDYTNLMSDLMEFGNSLRVTLKNDSIENIKELIIWVNVVLQQEDLHKIPICKKIKEEELIDELDTRLEENIIDNEYEITITEFEIVGTNEIFLQLDDNYKLSFQGHSKEVQELNNKIIRDFINEFKIEHKYLLDIKVTFYINSSSKFSKKIKDLLDYSCDEERAFLHNGIWFQYNDDYIDYLNSSMEELTVISNPDDDFSKTQLLSFQNAIFSEKRKMGETDLELKDIKNKYYKEKVFNILKERNEDFKNYDRISTKQDGHDYEVMDLYKDETIFAVKFGNSSSKLCYAFDQSIQSLKVYQHRLPGIEALKITNVAVWIFLEKNRSFDTSKRPILTELKMIMLKNKIDYWKKEIRLQGLNPIIYINYYIKDVT